MLIFKSETPDSKAWYGIEIPVWKMPEWNEVNLPFFHTKFRARYLQKNVLYTDNLCRVVLNNILTEAFNISYIRVLFFDE